MLMKADFVGDKKSAPLITPVVCINQLRKGMEKPFDVVFQEY